MNKHTKTPWWRGGFASIWSGVQEQSAINSDLVCILPGLDENREGNAEFIIRAVNSHDELVEALQDMLALVVNGVQGCDDDPEKMVERTREAINKATR